MNSSRILATTILFGALSLVRPVLADDEIFSVIEVATTGRTVTARFADFDGDGRKDLMLATLEGVPPAESRAIHIHLQTEDGSFPEVPSHSVDVPECSAVYDIADLRDTPGKELLLLRPDGISILSVSSAVSRQWDMNVAGPGTIGAAEDERGFDYFRMVYDEFGDEPWILVPQIGFVSIVDTEGKHIARLDVGRRANYFVSRSDALMSVESDLQLYFDVPKLSVGDVNGDKMVDIVAATRHEVRVFLRNEEGGFAEQASYSQPIELIDKRDHSRGTGSVITTAKDMDGDDRLDLMITHVEGSFVDTVTTSYIYKNRDGGWDLESPDDEFVSDGAWSSDLLMDIDDDDALELVRIQFRFSIFEMVELLLTRKMDSQVSIHRLQADGRYGDKPWSKRKISTGISFDTFRPNGFMPRARIDLNADGLMDFVTSANGKGIEIYLGGKDGPLANRAAMQKMPSAGVILFEDYDSDGLTDFLLYDSQSFDSTVRIGRNLGRLPGSPQQAN